MGIADSVLSAIPGVRRWWWRHKWTSLDIPAEEWAKLDKMTEDLHELLENVKSMQNLIDQAASLRVGHGMSTKIKYYDVVTGKEHVVESVIDGSSASRKIIEGHCKELDAYRLKMMDTAVKLGNWASDNAVILDYPDKPPLHTRLIAFVRNVKRIHGELAKAAQGRTPHEFLAYALLDKEVRKKRLAISPAPERVKLEKSKAEPPKETPKEAQKPKREQDNVKEERKRIAKLLPQTFLEQGVKVQFLSFAAGRAVTRYRLRLERGQKLSKAEGAAAEVAMALAVDKVAISKAPSETQVIFVDVPNKDVEPLLYKDVPKEEGKFFVGESIEGKPVFTDMESLCHVLIAGTTGSGKSVFLNTLICSLIQSPPEEVRLMMVDPKQVELTPYDGIPHLTRPVIMDAEKAVAALDEAVKEMERRYQVFAGVCVKKLSEYNEKMECFQEGEIPRLIVIIDELADLMMASDSEVESSIVRIAQKGRAAGIHLVLATQRPTKDVVTGRIKANIPTRIAFKVASAMESRIILDESGAEKLCGKGDMLFKPFDGNPQRLQGAYISNEDIERIVKGVKF